METTGEETLTAVYHISALNPNNIYERLYLGIHGYFDAFTASSLVGASKPDPLIFDAALRALNVRAEESIFVDDTREEADGARAMGFTAFHLDRSLSQPDFRSWTIGNLEHLAEFLSAGR